MKKTFIILAIIAAAALQTACTYTPADQMPPAGGGEYLTYQEITVSRGDWKMPPNETRAWKKGLPEIPRYGAYVRGLWESRQWTEKSMNWWLNDYAYSNALANSWDRNAAKWEKEQEESIYEPDEEEEKSKTRGGLTGEK